MKNAVNKYSPNDEATFERYSKVLSGLAHTHEITDIELNRCFNEHGFYSLSTIIDSLDWYNKFGISIERKRAISVNWPSGIKLVIHKYKQQLNSNESMQIGYNAVTLGDDITILDNSKFEMLGDGEIIEDELQAVLVGAAFAHWLPKLEDEAFDLQYFPQSKEAPATKDTRPLVDNRPAPTSDINSHSVTKPMDDKKNTERLIRWNGENTQLVYLFEQLKDAGLVVNIELIAAIENCFLDKSGKPIKNLHQTRNNMFMNDGRRPKRNADTIDDIVAKTNKMKE